MVVDSSVKAVLVVECHLKLKFLVLRASTDPHQETAETALDVLEIGFHADACFVDWTSA